MILGLTHREWFMFGIGSAVQGALMGALFHSLPFVLLNLACLGLDLCLWPRSQDEE